MNPEDILYPTAYIRWVRVDTGAPTRVLQQWWTDELNCRRFYLTPETCTVGEWCNVETIEPSKL